MTYEQRNLVLDFLRRAAADARACAARLPVARDDAAAVFEWLKTRATREIDGVRQWGEP